MQKCPKCGSRTERFVGSNKKDWVDECTNRECDYVKFSAEARRRLEESERNAKEGRTYLISCSTKGGRCVKSGEKLSLCSSCSIEESKKWYKIGRRDGIKSTSKRRRKNEKARRGEG